MKRHSTRLSEAHDDPGDLEATAAITAEAGEVHLASEDYPEMGTILTDRPDPGGVIRVIGSRTAAPRLAAGAAAYGHPDDARDGEYNGGEAGTGLLWAEPGQQGWKEEHLGPQEEAPPPPWMMLGSYDAGTFAANVMARLEQMREASQLFGTPRQEGVPPFRHAGTTINGTQVDHHGDAPEHGTMPRASDPASYDARSTEGDGDPTWSSAPPEEKRHNNGATVGMFPEGISSGSGPGLPIGAFTAIRIGADTGPMGAEAMAAHLAEAHGYTPDDVRLALSGYGGTSEDSDWSRARNALDGSHLADHASENFMHWEEHPHGALSSGRRDDSGPIAPRSSLGDLTDANSLRSRWEAHHPRDGAPPAPGSEPAQPGMATYCARPDGEPIDPVFGTRHVPWTDKERVTLHGWDGAPSASWGDFVNRSHFTNASPEQQSVPGSEEELMAQAAREPWEEWPVAEWHGTRPERPGYAEDTNEEFRPEEWSSVATPDEHETGPAGRLDHTLSAWHPSDEEAYRWHIQEGHGWTPEHVESMEARGHRPSDMHEALHDIGSGRHSHHPEVSVPDAWRAARHEQSLSNMFGPPAESNPGKDRPTGWPLANPAGGGRSGGDPMIGIIRSAPIQQLTGPADYEHRDPARFRRMMSALDLAHPHDGDEHSLDAGPSEDDDGFPEAHDDLDSPVPPQAWPMAGASVSEGGPAFTQGREDGNNGRKFPPPPVPAMPAPGGEGASGEDGEGGKKKISLEISAHLGAFVAAARDPRFRWEFTAAWSDVVAKAKRIRREGRVRITHASAGMVIGAVSGDHDVYESGIQRPLHKPQTIQHWACGCPWASFHQDASLGTRYAGRPCSHVMALQFEAQARTIHGREMAADPGVPNQELVVKSLPPWTPSGWARTWLAPSASLRRTATPDEARDQDDSPAREATAALLAAGEDRGEVDALRALAGLAPSQAVSQTELDWYARSRGGREQRQEGLRESQRTGRGWETELVPNPHFVASDARPEGGVTHLMRGYMNGSPAAVIGAGASNNQQAWKVHNLHVLPGHQDQGVGEAMMDSFYDHVKAAGGRWIDHGLKAGHDDRLWQDYAEPHPEMNIHNSHPDSGWNRYFATPRVHRDMLANAGTFPGTSAKPEWASTRENWHSVTNNWTKARGLDVNPRQGEWPEHPVNGLSGLREWPGRAIRPETGPPRREEPDEPAGPVRGQWRPIESALTAGLSPSTRMVERHLETAHGGDHDDARAMGISLARYHDVLHEMGADMTPPHSHDAPSAPAPGSWRPEASLAVTADQANAPWGSSNVAQRPPGKPYGATSPPDKDQDPGSYGPLAGPDPENWGGIQDDSVFQMPMTTSGGLHESSSPGGAAHPVPGDLHWPDMNGWEPVTHEGQEGYPYSNRSNMAGPSTSISPRDPNGIRMEEARRSPAMEWLRGHFDTERPHLTIPEGTSLRDANQMHHDDHDTETEDSARYQGHDGPMDPVFGALLWPVAELRDEPEAALPSTTGDDIEATAAQESFDDRRCKDCGEITVHGRWSPGKAYENYAVHDNLWGQAGGGRGLLCIGCLENRLGRQLNKDDFPDRFVNSLGPETDEYAWSDRTPRLRDRLTRDAAAPGVASPGELSARDRPEASGNVRQQFRTMFGGGSMGDLARETFPQAQQGNSAGQEPGMGSFDEPLSPDNPSIQTIGQQWSGGGADSDEVAVEPGQPQGSMDDIVASFQRSAAARSYAGDGGGQVADGDIAAAARQFLSKTADALPEKEASELIDEGRGQRARNLGLLQLEGTHYEDEVADLERRGLNLDDYDDDVISV
ncbi:MAG: hypothetical protein JWM19_932 [Actinomycetia bacterium]|nr:hypothetical protein [Actinomycetes bacterium]